MKKEIGYKMSIEEIALELTKLHLKNYSYVSISDAADDYLAILQRISQKNIETPEKG